MNFAELMYWLNTKLDDLEGPCVLVGRRIPIAAAVWAKWHNVHVIENDIAPPGKLYLMNLGALYKYEVPPPD